jgi:hypothetical protein
MSSKEKERNNKIKAKLSGHGIDGSWLNKAKSYMEENGYGINQISTKVVPYIQEEIKLVEEREFLKRKEIERKEKERKDQLELIEKKYIDFRNNAFGVILIKICHKELNIENCREISKSLLEGKVIRENKGGFAYTLKICFLVGIIYGSLYWMFDFVKNASDFHQKIILGIICVILLLPRAFKITFEPVELQTSDIFSGTSFFKHDMDSSILDYDKKILKLIEYSLKSNKSKFDTTLEEITKISITSPHLPNLTPSMPSNPNRIIQK